MGNKLRERIRKFGYSYDLNRRYHQGISITRQHPIVQEFIKDLGDFWWLKQARFYELETLADGACQIKSWNQPMEPLPSHWPIKSKSGYTVSNPRDAIFHVGYSRVGHRNVYITLDGKDVSAKHPIAKELIHEFGDKWWIPKALKKYPDKQWGYDVPELK